ncbi:MAG: hypothetical protein IJ206_09305 [Oscillospiraceae bacterium]|nr:hypothetical protein [Oscillospiraceae bacterium]
MEKAKFQMKTQEIEVKIEGTEQFVKEQANKSRMVYAAMIANTKGTETPPVILSPGAQTLSAGRVVALDQGNPWIDHDVVAIYDKVGIPSFMHRFRNISNRELFGGSENTNAVFVIDGEEYDEIYISVYPNCEINGKPYSLPWAKPWTGLTLEQMEEACFSKGEGWHMLTAPEWGLMANLSLKNGTLPHGNTDCGKFHGNPEERGELWENGPLTVTGSGPETWTHDHTMTGVHDLCGGIWERVRGLRLKDGKLQGADFNNAASRDRDLSENGEDWVDIWDDDGNPVFISAEDGRIRFTNGTCINGWSGAKWEDVQYDVKSEELRELGIFPGDPNNYLWADTEGERMPIAGGDWNSAALAGVFYWNLYYSRSDAYSSIGFRSAFYRKGSGKPIAP